MKNVLKLEEVAQLVITLVMLYWLPLQQPWWSWVLLFFAPDLSMVGYAVSTKAGGILYNVFHHKGIAIALLLAGLSTNNIALQAAGLLLWSHASFDRVLGYGLKHLDSFGHTHLGFIGKSKDL